MIAEEPLKASERKVIAKEAMTSRDVCISLICRTFLISETCYRYHPKLGSNNELITDLLVNLTVIYLQKSRYETA